jgi:hypothetical protein
MQPIDSLYVATSHNDSKVHTPDSKVHTLAVGRADVIHRAASGPTRDNCSSAGPLGCRPEPVCLRSASVNPSAVSSESVASCSSSRWTARKRSFHRRTNGSRISSRGLSRPTASSRRARSASRSKRRLGAVIAWMSSSRSATPAARQMPSTAHPWLSPGTLRNGIIDDLAIVTRIRGFQVGERDTHRQIRSGLPSGARGLRPRR